MLRSRLAGHGVEVVLNTGLAGFEQDQDG
ncbi:MAG: hypothetical protein QOJ56_288, partial [Mycobacterium sp.]|nr:hypothetical protein [Mycobacterium sp.]